LFCSGGELVSVEYEGKIMGERMCMYAGKCSMERERRVKVTSTIKKKRKRKKKMYIKN
jgi:hypothetical protein